MANNTKYTGTRMDLVIAMDIGTTFSGVSYTILRPGELIEIASVMEFSNQTFMQAKIPTVLCYDSNGNLLGVGPGTTDEALEKADDGDDEDEDEVTEWKRLRYIKMRFRPQGTNVELEMDELPDGLSEEDVMTDLMEYLYKETIKYIEEHHADGRPVLDQVKDRIQFVLTHPNGWAGMPQQRYRSCAVLAGLVPSEQEARRRIRFVSEGEASALSCLSSKFAPSPLPANYKFIVLDAGGGTLDVSAYRVVRASPLELEEIAIPDSKFAGSIFVNERARKHFEECLSDSKYDDGESISGLLDEFETKAKQNFDNASRKYSIKIPGVKGSVKDLGIVNGCLKVAGERIEEFFRFSVDNAIESVTTVRNRIQDAPEEMPIWLVGGFGASPWLFKQLKEQLGSEGFTVCKPDANQAKVVADGAIRFHMHRSVTSRLSPSCYGIACHIPFDPQNAEHKARKHLVTSSRTFGQRIGSTFSWITMKNKRIDISERADERDYWREVETVNEAKCSHALYAFDGDGSVPFWFQENREKFRKICDIKGDLSELCTAQAKKTDDDGDEYWLLDYSVELTLGSTEIEARIKWKHNGEAKFSEAQVAYI